MDSPLVSIIFPVLDEEETLPRVMPRLDAVFASREERLEVLFIDDGSTDSSPQILSDLADADARVRVITFSRNFGHQPAVTAGIEHALGDAVIVLDTDLQDPPEVLPDFLEQWKAGAQVVYGVRRRRKEGPLKRLAYDLYYRILAGAADIRVPLDAGDFCLMDREVVDHLNALPERNRFVRGLRAWVGFRQVGVPYERAARELGQSKYSFAKLFGLASLGLVSLSLRPLRLSMTIGLLMALASVGLAFGYLVSWFLHGRTWPAGFATLVILVTFFFGVQFILIGILGQYLGTIHEEVKGRPSYVVSRRKGFTPDDDPHPVPGAD